MQEINFPGKEQGCEGFNTEDFFEIHDIPTIKSQAVSSACMGRHKSALI